MLRALLCLIATCAIALHAVEVPKWGRFETSITNYTNKFRDVLLEATFTSPSGRTVPFWGFFDGDGSGGPDRLDAENWVADTGGEISGTVWKLRFMPDELGPWTYTWAFDDGSESGSGSFTCIAAGARPGPLNIDRTYNNRWTKNAEGPKLLTPVHTIPTGGELAYDIKDYQHVYDTYADMGFNFFVFPWMPIWSWNAGRTHEANNPELADLYHLIWYQTDNYNGNTADTYDTDRMNLFSWKRLDQHIGYLADQGIYTFGFQGFNVKRTAAIRPHTFAREKYDWYIRYSMARLAPYYNTVWNNTWESTNGAAWLWENLEVKGMDPWRRLWVNVEKDTADCIDRDIDSHAIPKTSDKLRWCIEHNGGTGLWGLRSPTGWGGGTHNIPDQRNVLRLYLKYYLRGALGFPLEYIDHTGVYEWSNIGTSAGYGYLSHFNAWIQTSGLGFWDMDCKDELVSGGGTTGFCLADPGDEYLVFREGGGSIDVDLSAVSGSLQLVRVNPYTGQEQPPEIVAGGSTTTFTTSGDYRLLHFKHTPVIIDNDPPTISAVTANPVSVTDDTTQLAVSANDPDGDSLTYSWSVSPSNTANIGTGNDPIVTFTEAGTYTITVLVSDGVNPAVSDTVQVTVNQSPTAVIITSRDE